MQNVDNIDNVVEKVEVDDFYLVIKSLLVLTCVDVLAGDVVGVHRNWGSTAYAS